MIYNRSTAKALANVFLATLTVSTAVRFLTCILHEMVCNTKDFIVTIVQATSHT